MTAPDDVVRKARLLQSLHRAPEILRVVNVWDAISAKVVAETPGTTAIATAGHSIAASLGYADGGMPLAVALEGARVVAAAVDLPVTADLDDGYADPGETIRRAVGLGIVGANMEDRLRPLPEAVARVRAAVAAAEAEGVPFQLNARTDAFVRGGDRDIDAKVSDAIERGRAYLDEGAALAFVPAVLDRATTERLVEGIGTGRMSVIGLPGALAAEEYEALGVARISYGPLPQRVALAALRELAVDLYEHGTVPKDLPALN